MSPDFNDGGRDGESTQDRWVVFSEGRGVMTRERLGVMLFLVAAAASFLLSIALWFTDHQDEGLFVGLWVPSILAAGGFWLTAVRAR
jgi:hypothetical protein